MAIHIEFYGVARLRSGCANHEIDVNEPITIRDLLAMLASRFPDLARECFDGAGEGFQLKSAYTLNCNGRFVRDARRLIADGDEVLLLAADAGG